MKKLTILLIMLVMTGICAMGYAREKGNASGPDIRFEAMTHDFGQFRVGEMREYNFKFVNSGNAPLVITDVEQPCGCTIPTWSKEPIMPGMTGTIKVTYNSKDRPGEFRKTLQVKTNNPQQQFLMLMIKGNAVKARYLKS